LKDGVGLFCGREGEVKSEERTANLRCKQTCLPKIQGYESRTRQSVAAAVAGVVLSQSNER
jgi:hypothetical protein